MSDGWRIEGNRLYVPETPLDGYEIVYFTADFHADVPCVHRIRHLYHVNRPWLEVCKDRGPNGADFVDQWQLFDTVVLSPWRKSGEEPREEFQGRNEGWRALSERDRDYSSCFKTLEEAYSCLVTVIKVKIVATEKRLDSLRRAAEGVEGLRRIEEGKRNAEAASR